MLPAKEPRPLNADEIAKITSTAVEKVIEQHSTPPAGVVGATQQQRPVTKPKKKRHSRPPKTYGKNKRKR